MSTELAAIGSRQPLTPPAPTGMWVSGGVDREKWMAFRFTPGLLIEGAIRDDEQKAQGTMIMEVLEGMTTDAHGHWFRGKYITASDPHMRWWMKEGAGAALAGRCAYHACEGPSIDCTVTRRGASMHLERFRALNQKEINNHVPEWAFDKTCGKDFIKYLKGKGMAPGAKKTGAELPWVDPGEDDSDDEEAVGSGGESSSGGGLKAKLLKARDEVGRLEKELKEAHCQESRKEAQGGGKEEEEEEEEEEEAQRG